MAGCRSSVVERILGKAEVVSSILTGSTIQFWISCAERAAIFAIDISGSG
jgi:hypothetical protein